MITGVEVQILKANGEIAFRKYVIGQMGVVDLPNKSITKEKVTGIDISGGMENRLRIRFEGGRGISYNLTANNIVAWRTQVDGYYDKQSNYQSGIEWHDMAL